jgi:predicted transcriptional regulator
MRRPKIDREKLHALARKGTSQGKMASAFGVSQAAISKALKDLERETTRCLTAPPTSARKSAARIIENSINAAEQLLKINKNANELLDLVMAWQRGDDVALQILESQVCMRKIRVGKEIEQVKEYRFKDPRELALFFPIRSRFTNRPWSQVTSSSISTGGSMLPGIMRSGFRTPWRSCGRTGRGILNSLLPGSLSYQLSRTGSMFPTRRGPISWGEGTQGKRS